MANAHAPTLKSEGPGGSLHLLSCCNLFTAYGPASWVVSGPQRRKCVSVCRDKCVFGRACVAMRWGGGGGDGDDGGGGVGWRAGDGDWRGMPRRQQATLKV